MMRMMLFTTQRRVLLLLRLLVLVLLLVSSSTSSSATTSGILVSITGTAGTGTAVATDSSASAVLKGTTTSIHDSNNSSTKAATIINVIGIDDDVRHNNDSNKTNQENKKDSDSNDSNGSDFYFPLFLSCLAGGSTCIGASIIFCFQSSTIYKIMSFSLSLAASVMITISIISLLPEVYDGMITYNEYNIDVVDNVDSTTDGTSSENNNMKTEITIMYHPKIIMERIGAFFIGVIAYLILSKLLVFLPDPEDIYLLASSDDGNKVGDNGNYDLYLSLDDNDDNGNNTDNDNTIMSDELTSLEENWNTLSNNNNTNNNTKTTPLLLVRQRKTTKVVVLHHSTSTDTIPSLSSSSNNNKQQDNIDNDHKQDNNNNNDQQQDNNNNNNENEDKENEDFTTTAFSTERRKRSWRVALMLFTSLLIHNFPEGLCVAASAKESPELGITVAIGIFIHNVPEGIAISVPCMVARPDRPWLAFWLASISGLAEPIGALVALFFLRNSNDNGNDNDNENGLDLKNVLSFVSGVMITVSIWELYPEAIKSIIITNNKSNNNNSNHEKNTTTILRMRRMIKYYYQYYRSIIWGTITGACLMIATELYV